MYGARALGLSTYDLPNEPEWPVKDRKAAYCARQGRRLRLDLETTDLALQDAEDLIQVPIQNHTMPSGFSTPRAQ